MRQFQIISARDQSILYEGQFYTFTQCLEQAVADAVNLEGADLSGRNLTNAMLDDAILTGACLSNCNLTGANLSEAALRGACFAGADLYNTCFAMSDMRGCGFEGASFGATDISGCDLSHSVFSTLSCFSLDFTGAAMMTGCMFKNPDGRIEKMSRPPLVIRGLKAGMVVFMDHCVKIDHEILDHVSGLSILKNKSCIPA